MKSLIMVGAALVLMGCSAIPVAQQEKTLVAKNVCCSGVKEFDYEPLKQDKETKFLLDEKSPAYQFGSQKSYFKAFAILIPVLTCTTRSLFRDTSTQKKPPAGGFSTIVGMRSAKADYVPLPLRYW